MSETSSADKLTPKQHAFCLAYIESGNASEAYRQAYDASNTSPNAIHVRACELLKHSKIRVMIDKLQADAAQRNAITIDDLIRELDEARVLAMKNPRGAGAAVSATMGKAKLLGFLVDKSEVTGKDGNPLEIEQREWATQELMDRLRRLAERNQNSTQAN